MKRMYTEKTKYSNTGLRVELSTTETTQYIQSLSETFKSLYN